MNENLNNELEKSVLGGLLTDISIINACIGILNDDCFHSPYNRIIYRVIKDLYDKGEAITMISVAGGAEKNEKFNGNAMLYIRECVTSVVNPMFSEEECIKLLEISDRRKFYKLGRRLVNEAPDTPVSDLNRIISDTLSGVNSTISDVIHIGEVAERIYTNLSDKDWQPEVYKTGILDLDKILSINPSDFVLVSAPTSHGKTIFLLQTAVNMMLAGHRALFISLEMSVEQNVNRIISQLTGVPLNVLIRNYGYGYNQMDWIKISEIREKISELPLWFNNPKKRTLSEVTMLIKSAIHKYGVDVCFIDYGQMVSIPMHRGNEESRIHEITSTLRALSLAANIPIIAGMQPNRQGSGNRDSKNEKDLRPRISDIKGSGYAEQDASIVILLWIPEKYGLDSIHWRGEEYHTGELGEVIVAKNRDGESGQSVLVRTNLKCVRFEQYQGSPVNQGIVEREMGF